MGGGFRPFVFYPHFYLVKFASSLALDSPRPWEPSQRLPDAPLPPPDGASAASGRGGADGPWIATTTGSSAIPAGLACPPRGTIPAPARCPVATPRTEGLSSISLAAADVPGLLPSCAGGGAHTSPAKQQAKDQANQFPEHQERVSQSPKYQEQVS